MNLKESELDDAKSIMGRLLKMPHKPHVPKPEKKETISQKQNTRPFLSNEGD